MRTTSSGGGTPQEGVVFLRWSGSPSLDKSAEALIAKPLSLDLIHQAPKEPSKLAMGART